MWASIVLIHSSFFFIIGLQRFFFSFLGRARSTCIVQCQGNSRAPFEMPSTGWMKLKKLGWRRKEKKRKKVVGCHCVRDDARSTSRTVVGCKRFITRAATLTIEKEKEKRELLCASLFIFCWWGDIINCYSPLLLFLKVTFWLTPQDSHHLLFSFFFSSLSCFVISYHLGHLVSTPLQPHTHKSHHFSPLVSCGSPESATTTTTPGCDIKYSIYSSFDLVQIIIRPPTTFPQ